jgi:hypothetical protein
MPSKAEKLLARMRRSHAGWRLKDLVTVYEGFGFIIRSGANHEVVTHPDYPQLRATLARHPGAMPKIYVRDLIRNIDEYLEMRADNQDE